MDDFFSKLEATVVNSAEYFISRQEKNSSDYPFIDTKFNIRTGKDFDNSCEEFRRRDCIYGWIQGRGIESMAVHAEFFAGQGISELANRFKKQLKHTVSALEQLRLSNGGWLSFAMTPEGKPRFSAPAKYSNYTDLFYFKGLCSAALELDDNELFSEAEKLLSKVADDILNRRFGSDQYMFDPANRGKAEDGKFSQGPLMILLDGTAVTSNWTLAEKLISLITDKHLNNGKFPELPSGCFVESLKADDTPWIESDDRIICDPGHALEFTGLAAKNLVSMRSIAKHRDFVSKISPVLAELFCKVYDIGLQENSGVIKSYDLKKGEIVNSDAPWWSLPEAIRAAVLLAELVPDMRVELLRRAQILAGRFESVYISQGTNFFACQMCNSEGKAVDVIPAVPDADPLYHTNLSLIDALACKTQ